MSKENQIDREDCYICGSGNADILERHHIVPCRHGGSDNAVNLVDLCPTCHRALETLYNKRFYRALDVISDDVIDSDAEDDRQKSGEHTATQSDSLPPKPSKSRRIMRENIFDAIDEHMTETGAPVDRVKDEAKQAGTRPVLAEKMIVELRHVGDLYEPKTGYLRRSV